VTQRKCGTCRFFEEGGIAASGWCRHPMRQHLEQMVLVRKSELACRNDWDKDLWEVREAGQPAVVPAVPVTVGATVERVGSLVVDETDTLASITIAPLVRPARPPRSAPRLAEPFQPQESSRPLPQAASAGRPQISGLSDVLPSRSTDAPGARPDSEHRDSESAAPREAMPRSNRVETAPQRPPAVRPSAEQLGSAPEQPVRRTVSPARPAPERRPENAESRRFGWLDEDARPAVPPSEPPAIQRPAETGSRWVETRSGSTEPFDVVRPPRSDGAEAAPEAVSTLPTTEPMVSPLIGTAAENMPRCCATCRDFRPAESGQRGWCNNRFAFDQRRMVQGDEIACAGSVGNWWVPTDDWWLQRGDISHHARPTPSVDEYLHRMLARRREAR